MDAKGDRIVLDSVTDHHASYGTHARRTCCLPHLNKLSPIPNCGEELAGTPPPHHQHNQQEQVRSIIKGYRYRPGARGTELRVESGSYFYHYQVLSLLSHSLLLLFIVVLLSNHRHCRCCCWLLLVVVALCTAACPRRDTNEPAVSVRTTTLNSRCLS
jgi:hypothetical protein